MSFTAMGKPLDWTCWLLYFGNLAWTVAYDTQYAITDREYDLKIGVKSTAILFGKYDIQIISFIAIDQCIVDWYSIVFRKYIDSIWLDCLVIGCCRFYLSMDKNQSARSTTMLLGI
jgi:4-hydroxybenzoate polyprenyltransferase